MLDLLQEYYKGGLDDDIVIDTKEFTGGAEDHETIDKFLSDRDSALTELDKEFIGGAETNINETLIIGGGKLTLDEMMDSVYGAVENITGSAEIPEVESDQFLSDYNMSRIIDKFDVIGSSDLATESNNLDIDNDITFTYIISGGNEAENITDFIISI